MPALSLPSGLHRIEDTLLLRVVVLQRSKQHTPITLTSCPLPEGKSRAYGYTKSMKKVNFQKNFSIDEKANPPPVFAEYVEKTAKLIDRPYMQTFKMVEDWQLHKIIRRYKECMSYSGAIPKDVLWWSLRKRDKHQ